MKKIKFLILYAIAFWVQIILIVAISFSLIGPRPSGLIAFGTVMAFWTSYKIVKAFLSKNKDTE